jgi:hypothetical protein
VCAEMVPKNLSEDQKLNGEEMCHNVLEKNWRRPRLSQQCRHLR